MSNPNEEWRVVVTMRPIKNGFDEGPFQFEESGADRFDARRKAYQHSCMNGTLNIEVYSDSGTLEYQYSRSDNIFRPISEESKRIHAEEIKEIYERAKATKSGDTIK